MSLLLVFILQTIASFIDRLRFPQHMGGGKKVKKTKVRLAHELPKRRKIAIQEALAAHKPKIAPSGTEVQAGEISNCFGKPSNRVQ